MHTNTYKWLFFFNLVYAVLLVVFPFSLLAYLYLDDYQIPTIIVAVEFIFIFIAFFIVLLGLKNLLNTLADFERINKIIMMYLTTIFLIYAILPIGYVIYKIWDDSTDLAAVLIVLGVIIILALGVLYAILEIIIGSRLKTCSHNLFGLRKTIGTSYFILGISNLVSLLITVTIIISVIIYTFLPMLTTLLFYSAWKNQAGVIANDFTYSK